MKEIENYSDLLEEVNDYSWGKLTRETGCYGKCHYKEYTFTKVKQSGHFRVEHSLELQDSASFLMP